MSDTAFGLVGLSALFILLALRMPVALAMALVGVVGFGIMNGWGPAVSMLADEAFVISNNYELIVIPLFILMGNFASTSGMSRDLYNAAYAWFGHWRGGLASATIAACAAIWPSFSATGGMPTVPMVSHMRRATPTWNCILTIRRIIAW